MGAVPPEESIRMFDQMTPVEICTDATLPRAMLSSLLPNRRDLTRLTCCGVTMMRTGKKRLPLVHRLAVKVSEVGRSGMVGFPDRNIAELRSARRGRASAATRLYPFEGAFFPYPEVAYDQNHEE